MSSTGENDFETVINDDITTEVSDETEAGISTNDNVNAVESSEFALRLVNAVKSMNIEEISHYDLVNSFTFADEQKCLFLFIKALPYDPIVPMYPENPFLFFKGVIVPRSFNLTEDLVKDIENFMTGQSSENLKDLHLHDLEPYYLDAYESAVRIYNDMAEKTRNSYLANVKQAKSQVIEISAAMVCGLIVILALIGLN